MWILVAKRGTREEGGTICMYIYIYIYIYTHTISYNMITYEYEFVFNRLYFMLLPIILHLNISSYMSLCSIKLLFYVM